MTKETTFAHPPKGHVAIVAYDSANDQWQAIYVDASGRIQVDVAAAEALAVNLYGWDGTTAHKLGLVWGYSDRLSELKSATTTTGDNALALTAVPTGYVYVVQGVNAWHSDTVAKAVNICCYETGGAYTTLLSQSVSLAPSVAIVNGLWVLKATDTVQGFFGSMTVGKSIYVSYWGYKMQVNQ